MMDSVTFYIVHHIDEILWTFSENVPGILHFIFFIIYIHFETVC